LEDNGLDESWWEIKSSSKNALPEEQLYVYNMRDFNWAFFSKQPFSCSFLSQFWRFLIDELKFYRLNVYHSNHINYLFKFKLVKSLFLKVSPERGFRPIKEFYDKSINILRKNFNRILLKASRNWKSFKTKIKWD